MKPITSVSNPYALSKQRAFLQGRHCFSFFSFLSQCPENILVEMFHSYVCVYVCMCVYMHICTLSQCIYRYFLYIHAFHLYVYMYRNYRIGPGLRVLDYRQSSGFSGYSWEMVSLGHTLSSERTQISCKLCYIRAVKFGYPLKGTCLL